jgi:hypothetical protein
MFQTISATPTQCFNPGEHIFSVMAGLGPGHPRLSAVTL